MEKLVFRPEIDLPLCVLTAIGFLIDFRHWARTKSADTTVDLQVRLPVACFRVVALLVGWLVFCWLTNVAFWLIFALLLLPGVALGLVAEGHGGCVFLFAAALMIREWAFGFPQLILHPDTRNLPKTDSLEIAKDLIGEQGVVVAPLRPSGEIQIGDRVVSVISDDGQLIDTGTTVVVSGARNGRICVRTVDLPAEQLQVGDESAPSL